MGTLCIARYVYTRVKNVLVNKQNGKKCVVFSVCSSLFIIILLLMLFQSIDWLFESFDMDNNNDKKNKNKNKNIWKIKVWHSQSTNYNNVVFCVYYVFEQSNWMRSILPSHCHWILNLFDGMECVSAVCAVLVFGFVIQWNDVKSVLDPTHLQCLICPRILIVEHWIQKKKIFYWFRFIGIACVWILWNAAYVTLTFI